MHQPDQPDELRFEGDEIVPSFSLRDFMAVHALPAVHAEYMAMKEGAGLTLADYHDMAADTYRLADALMKARSA